jgi:uncharacterized alpha-E superfamily protein
MMLSRVADNLYWLARYLERAEHTLRLLKVGLDMQLDLQSPDATGAWERIAFSLHLPPQNGADEFELVRSLVLDGDNPASILANIRNARENARQVREQISTEMWEQLNRLFLGLPEVDLAAQWDENIFEFFQQQLRELHTFEGITNSTLNHGAGWHFMRIGQLIERAVNTVNLLDFYAGSWTASRSPEQYLNWVMLLRDCTAFEAYCKVYSADLHFPQIVDFLLLNAEFPHAVNYAVIETQAALDHIAERTATPRSGRLYRLIGRLTADLRFAAVDEILADDLHLYLTNVRQTCEKIHAAVYDNYIGYPIEAKLPTR